MLYASAELDINARLLSKDIIRPMSLQSSLELPEHFQLEKVDNAKKIILSSKYNDNLTMKP